MHEKQQKGYCRWGCTGISFTIINNKKKQNSAQKNSIIVTDFLSKKSREIYLKQNQNFVCKKKKKKFNISDSRS